MGPAWKLTRHTPAQIVTGKAGILPVATEGSVPDCTLTLVTLDFILIKSSPSPHPSVLILPF